MNSSAINNGIVWADYQHHHEKSVRQSAADLFSAGLDNRYEKEDHRYEGSEIEESMELDWDNEDDGSESSWGIMDRADQEAIEEELLELTNIYRTERTIEGAGAPGYDGRRVVKYDRGEHQNAHTRPHSPIAQHEYHFSDSHRYVITPEQTNKTATMKINPLHSRNYEHHDDIYQRLALLVHRSDRSRKSFRTLSCLQNSSEFYSSSRFLTIEMERQQLKRILTNR